MVQTAVDKLRDDVTANGIDRNGKVYDVEQRVRGLERWQARSDCVREDESGGTTT